MINSPTDGKKFLRSLIIPSIKEGDCSDAWNFFERHYSNGSYHIQGVYSDQSYSTAAHSYSFRIIITIAEMRILTASILDVSTFFQNTIFLFIE